MAEWRRRLQWQMLHHGPRRVVAVATPHGAIAFDSRDRGVGKALFLGRGYELEGIRAALRLLRAHGWLPPGGTVVDAGANIGVTAIPLLAEGGFERALAFEPEPRNFALLRRNLARNRLDERVIAEACALSDRGGALELELSPDNWGDHRLRVSSGAGERFRESARATVRVPVTTLDGYLAEHGEPPESIRLIWMDIQGHEVQCLRGAERLLARGVPVVSEFWPYGMQRAGIGPDEYLWTASRFFAGFAQLPGGDSVRPISELAALFEALRGPRQMGQIVLLPKR